MRMHMNVGRLFGCLRKNRSGAIAVEYALAIAFFAIVAAAGMTVLGDGVTEFFTRISALLLQADQPLPPLSS